MTTTTKLDTTAVQLLTALEASGTVRRSNAYLARETGLRTPSNKLRHLRDAGLVESTKSYRSGGLRWTITDAGVDALNAFRVELGQGAQQYAAPANDEAAMQQIAAMENDLNDLKAANARLRLEQGSPENFFLQAQAITALMASLASLPAAGERATVKHPTYNELIKLLECGVTRIWLSGEAGMGKTFGTTQAAAEALDIPLFIITPVSDKYELFGYKDANGNYQETELYRWATHEGPALLLLDEVDGSAPNAMIAMNAVLANGVAVFPNGQVRIADDKIVIATANTTGDGPTMRYNSRVAQDGAFLDRFDAFPHWGLHAPTERAIAEAKHPGSGAAVTASQRIRANLETYGIEMAWGPRRTYAMARLAAKFTLEEAAKLAGLCKLDEASIRNALRGI